MDTLAIIYIVSIIVSTALFLRVKLSKKKQWIINGLAYKKIKGPKWYEFLIIWVFAPIYAPIALYLFFRSKYYENRPIPIPKEVRGFVKKDLVRSKEGETLSIAEFNHRYKTSFTLDDVYGKGYLASLSIAEKEKFETPESFESGVSVKDDAEDDIYTPFYKAFITARKDDDYSSMLDYLSDNIKLVRYKNCVLTGKDAFVEYWKNAWKFNQSKSSTHKTIIQQCPYLGRVALYDIWDKSNKICFLAYMKDGRITHAVVLPEYFLNNLYLNHFQLNEPILDWETVQQCMEEIVEPEANHIPCLECGTLSENLEWHKFTYRMGLHGYEGIMSICHRCKKEVEMHAESRIRYESFEEDDARHQK